MEKIFAVIISLFFFLVGPSLILAQSPTPPQTIIVPREEIINRDYFASGSSVTLSGTVNGDAYLAGGNIIVDGVVNGDLLAAGGTIDVRGTVTGNIRLAGGQVSISSQVGRNASILAGSIYLANNGLINGSLAAAGGTVNIYAPIGRDANISAGQITFGNAIGGDVNATGEITLLSSAAIAGNLTYLSATQANIQPGATVSGQTTQNMPPPSKEIAPTAVGIFTGAKLFFSSIYFISHLIVGLLLLRFFPFFLGGTYETIKTRFWASLGIGLLVAIVTPIIVIILLITVLGIPLALILLALYLIAIFLTKIIVSFAIGRKLTEMFNWRIGWGWAFFVGLIIYTLLTLIPVIGWLTSLIATLLGLGAIYIGKRAYFSDLRTKKLP